MDGGGGGRGGGVTTKSKESLKSKLDGNQLDLSLSGLDIVPVKELAALPKATYLDLSCNRLTSLTNEFSTLTHIVKLDLSKNQLSSLPADFGDLQRLQHLDLYNNALSDLPISFCRLGALKWLDIRDNKLSPGLLQAAGDCLNETQCRNAAKQVVAYMKVRQSDEERERQKRLKEERERAAAQKIEDELAKQRAQQEKKAQKEQRRQELEAKRARNNSHENAGNGTSSNQSATLSKSETKIKPRKREEGGASSWWPLLIGVLFFIAGLLVSVYIYCQSNESHDMCVIGHKYLESAVENAHIMLDHAHNKAHEVINAVQRLINPQEDPSKTKT